MKPHFWRRMNFWFCGTTRTACDWGLGHTPQEAYEQYLQGGWYAINTQPEYL